MFLRTSFEAFLSETIFRSRIQDIVDARLGDKLPRLAEKHIDYALPGLVAKQIMEQVPKYLDQNKAMQDILSSHKASVTAELERSVRVALDRIANESQYHDVRQAYIRSIDGKFSDQLKAQNDLFMSNMEDRLDIIDNLDKRVQSLEYWNKALMLSSFCGVGISIVLVLAGGWRR